ncbi:ROK family protein [Paenibacillus albidus]|uniref:ROK family protein n=1 Tax=Paenibacillus albidus TaxID=2041023 RepID=UPI001BE7A2DA|nr:ROK family protein [Paenibacillus albidus]
MGIQKRNILILSPQKVIMGGGVMKQEHLFQLVRIKLKEFLNGYVQHQSILLNIEKYVVPTALGDNAGLTDALALTRMAVE